MLKNYLKIALRNLHKQKAFTFINVAGLSVGMACCLLILTYVRDELSYDRFHENAEHIYRVVLDGRSRNGVFETAQTAPAWGPMLVEEYPEVVNAVRFKPPNQKWLVNYEDKRFFERGFVFTDSTVFDVFTYPFVQGNPETALEAPFTVVLTETMAEKYFGSENPIGKVLRLDNTFDFEVTGVLENIPQQAHLEITFLASMSSLRTPIYGGEGFLNQTVGPALYTYLLVQPGTPAATINNRFPGFIDQHIGGTLTTIGIEMNPYVQRLTDIHLHSNLENEIQPNGDTATLYVFASIAIFILLIACINFMNLSTARSARRAREVGLRKVFGAERTQLILQFLGESLLLACGALVMAVIFGWLSLPLFNTLTGKVLFLTSTNGGIILLFLVAMTLFVGLVAGSYPALFLSAFRPARVLKGTMPSNLRGASLRKVLVVFQFAISIFMIIGTMVVFNQLKYLRNKQLGFDKDHVVMVQLTDPAIRNEYFAFRTRVEQIPDVLNVSASSSAPGSLVMNELIVPQGAADDESRLVTSYSVDYDIVEALGLELAAGRSFSRNHQTDFTESFVINETAVNAFGWSSPEEALDKELRNPGGQLGRIIGVVQDFHSKSLHQRIEPLVMQMRNEQAFFYLFARIQSNDLRSTIRNLEAAWTNVYPAYIFEYSFLDEDFDRLYAAEDRLRDVFGLFSILTIFIACMGLFGLASFTAEQRTKEIGLRKTLGASISGIVFLLSQEFSKYVLVAFVLSAPLAYLGMTRWLENFAYHTEVNVVSILIAGAVALCIAWLTVSYQAFKAAMVNPVDALRYE